MAMTSCSGYRWGSLGVLAGSYKTINVPYVEGDKDGKLTASIIRELDNSAGGLAYQQHASELMLRVEIKDTYNENIGFRYKKDESGDSFNDIIQVESRMLAKAEVSVEEALTGRTIVGPVVLDAHVDYDYDIDSNRSNLIDFSLGQMTTNENAADIARDPLNHALAVMIVSYINHIW